MEIKLNQYINKNVKKEIKNVVILLRVFVKNKILINVFLLFVFTSCAFYDFT